MNGTRIAIALFAALVTTSLHAQSLADVARKTQEDRAKMQQANCNDAVKRDDAMRPGDAPTEVHAQSLADAAKKAQEDSAKVKQGPANCDSAAKADDATKNGKTAAPKVWTNKDLDALADDAASSPLTVASSAPVGTAPASEPPTPAVASDLKAGAGGVKTEAYWKERMTALRDKLAQDKATCEPIAAKIGELNSIYASDVFIDRTGAAKINTAAAATIETKLTDAKAEQQKCLAGVALDQTAIDAATEEARRLGVLPGWLR